MQNEALGRRQLLVLAILFEGGLGGLACLAGWLLDVPVWEKLHADADAAALGAAASVPMMGLFLLCLRCPFGPLRRIKHISVEAIRPLFVSCTLLDLLLVALLAGFGEELFFRGLVQTLCRDTFGLDVWSAVAAASVLFGLLHLITPTYAMLATLMGVYLGWLWLVSDNLLAPSLAHGLYDFAALVYLVHGMAPAPEP